MNISSRDGIRITNLAMQYNFNELLYLITIESNPDDLARALYHTILTLQRNELEITDHEESSEHADIDMSNLTKLFGAVCRMKSKTEPGFRLCFHPIVEG